MSPPSSSTDVIAFRNSYETYNRKCQKSEKNENDFNVKSSHQKLPSFSNFSLFFKKLSKFSFINCQTPIIWRNVALMSTLHLIFLYVCLATVTGSINLRTVAIFWLYAFTSAFGILAGAHRLWSHRAYKARLPLRAFLMILQTASLQNDLLDWTRNHRVHHRFSETDADPHNSNRGLFFAHIGWLLCKKHPEVARLGATVCMEDVLTDPVVKFQRRYYRLLVFIFWLVLPVSVSMICLQESLTTSLLVNVWRYVVSLHNTWLVNSLAHWHGSRPYNRHIQPRENKLVTYFSLGEGYHNWHHTFPWDYSASELGWRQNYNLATAFIDLAAWLGLAYELRVPSQGAVARRIQLTGDVYQNNQNNQNIQLNSSGITNHRLLVGFGSGLEKIRNFANVFADTFIGLLTLTIPVWSLALGRLLLTFCPFAFPT